MKKEASPNPSEKPPQPLRKEGSFLLDEDLQYSPCLSSPERMGLPSFRRGRGRLFCGFFVPLGTPCNLLAINVCALCV